MLLDTLPLYQFAGTETAISGQTKGPARSAASLLMVKCRRFAKGIRTRQAYMILLTISFSL